MLYTTRVIFNAKHCFLWDVVSKLSRTANAYALHLSKDEPSLVCATRFLHGTVAAQTNTDTGSDSPSPCMYDRAPLACAAF